MGNVSYHFFTALFNAVLIYILAINFLGWSGGYMDILGQTTTSNWNGYYFGFQSLQAMLNDLNVIFGDETNGSFTLGVLRNNINSLIDTTFFGLPKVIGWIKGGNWNAMDIFTLVRHLFVQPIEVFIYTFLVVGHIVWYVFNVIGVVLKAFSGTYNIPFTDIPDYRPDSLMFAFRTIVTIPVLV